MVPVLSLWQRPVVVVGRRQMGVVFGLVVLSSTACVTKERVVRSRTVPRGEYLARPTSSEKYVAVLLSRLSGATQAAVGRWGRCAVVQVGVNQRVIVQEKKITTEALVITGVLVGGALIVYADPQRGQGDAEVHMTVGTALLATGGAVSGISALMQGTETTELPPRPAERFAGTRECLLNPVVDAVVALEDAQGVLEARTDVRGIAVFEREVDPKARVFVDKTLVRRVKWQEP
jgi:hypothetical protein